MSDELAELYQQVILDHSKSPRHFHAIEAPTAQAEGRNPLCGDHVTIYVRGDGDTLEEVAFTGSGCAICTASSSVMAEMLTGSSREEAEAMFEQFHALLTGEKELEDVEESLGKLAVFAGVRKYPVRVKCATLPWHTVHTALEEGNGEVTTE